MARDAAGTIIGASTIPRHARDGRKRQMVSRRITPNLITGWRSRGEIRGMKILSERVAPACACPSGGCQGAANHIAAPLVQRGNRAKGSATLPHRMCIPDKARPAPALWEESVGTEHLKSRCAKTKNLFRWLSGASRTPDLRGLEPAT